MGSCPTLPGTRGTMRNLLCLFAVVAAASANPLLLGGNNNDGGGIKPGGGSFPFVTTETFTQTVVTDSYCYTTEKKLLGPKTKECSRRRAIDTSNIFGIAAGDEVANAISPTVTQVKPEEANSVAMLSLRRRQKLCSVSLPPQQSLSSAHQQCLSSTCAMVARRMANLTSSTTRVTRSLLVEMEVESAATVGCLELESKCHHMGRTVISISK